VPHWLLGSKQRTARHAAIAAPNNTPVLQPSVPPRHHSFQIKTAVQLISACAAQCAANMQHTSDFSDKARCHCVEPGKSTAIRQMLLLPKRCLALHYTQPPAWLQLVGIDMRMCGAVTRVLLPAADPAAQLRGAYLPCALRKVVMHVFTSLMPWPALQAWGREEPGAQVLAAVWQALHIFRH
jgi:hypothetical protein